MFKKLKINTIFWKIFLSYWAAMILTILVTVIVVGIVFDRDKQELRRQFDDRFFANAALLVYEEGGALALKRWLRKRAHAKGKHTFLINEQGQDVLGKPLPHSVQRMIRTGEPEVKSDMPGRWALISLESSSGDKYWYVSFIHNKYGRSYPPRDPLPNLPLKDSKKPGKWHGEWQEYGRQGGRPAWAHGPEEFGRNTLLLLAVIVSGLISLLLARHFSRPIRQLQKAARDISGGDLTVRVPVKLQHRSDEFGELGRDFDRMAETIDKLIASQKRLLGDVSHELRTPLARLQVALELARKSTGGVAENEHARIEREAQKLDELIGQVLSLVRLTTRTEALEMQRCDLLELIQLTIDDANYEAQGTEKTVALTQGQSVDLNVNADLLQSAIENIIRNAVRYTQDRTSVEVEVTVSEDNVGIRVRDFGPGVAEEALGHLFEPFYRESAARDRTSGGYGLGLAIAERAIALHGGTVSASNAQNGGLIIEINLPRNE